MKEDFTEVVDIPGGGFAIRWEGNIVNITSGKVSLETFSSVQIKSAKKWTRKKREPEKR